MITLQQYIQQWIHQLLQLFWTVWDRCFGDRLTFEDSGVTVRIQRTALAEGGFSVVYKAQDIRTRREYALKRLRLHDVESRQACQWEASVHRRLQEGQPTNAKYLMPLCGYLETPEYAYLLFPLLNHSMREEVNRRTFYNSNSNAAPWSNESDLLQIVAHVAQGLSRMHANHMCHLDLKVENILCQGSNTQHLLRPVLMDFGSAQSPTSVALQDRSTVLNLVDRAATHTTISYRPPELFAGELRAGDADLDLCKVDVWSLGCLLFALAFGASPMESQFPSRCKGNEYPLQVVECSQSRVLGPIPRPPSGTPAADWYSADFWELMEWMLTKDRVKRPTLGQVEARLQALLHRSGGAMDLEANHFEVDF